MKKGSRPKYRADFSGDFKFDYKEPTTLYRFLAEAGKIVPARISKLSHKQQKDAARAVKKARAISLLPVGTGSYDGFGFPEQISPKPFEL